MTNMVIEQQDTLVVKLDGDVDLESSAGIRKMLLDLLIKKRDLVVDLSGVEYIDSSGIANLVEALQTANDQGTKFSLAAVSPQAMRVLELARLDKVFKIHGDVDQAIAQAG